MLACGAATAHAITLPPGFDDEFVANTLRPTAFAFTPDGRMLITSKAGPVNVIEDDQLVPEPAITLDPCTGDERGVLGVAVDPQFATSRNIFIYYTFDKHGTCETNTQNTPVNRVSRFILGDDNVIDPASETVLIDNIPSIAGIHNAGDLQFGPDGLLYVSIGDGGCDFRFDSGCGGLNDAARDLGGLSGKILRVTRNGQIPAGNPYQGPGTARCNVTGSVVSPMKCQEIFSWGLRNPWRIGFDYDAPGARFFINDVGNAKREEVDVGAAGADYGWNVREGACERGSDNCPTPTPPGMTDPLYEYHHDTGCTAITSSGFVPDGIWPTEYDQSYLFGDTICGKFFELRNADPGPPVVTEFATEVGNGLVTATFGPRPGGYALYYASWEGGGGDQIRRITYVGNANRNPTARIAATPTYGDLPLTVAFDASESSDRDNDPLTFDWDFGDGSPIEHGVSPNHTYTQDGTFTVTLTAHDPNGGVGQATTLIYAGDNPPQPTIELPAPSKRFRVGEQIQLQGSATDPEDGTLPGSALEWEVLRHHNTHTHPFLPPTPGAQTAITGPPPEDITAAATSWLELRLTATDSEGLATTVTQDLDPKTVQLTFASEPTALGVEISGVDFTTPATVTSWEDWALPVNAPDQAGLVFLNWSDGGARTHDIVTPPAPASYKATFHRPYARARSASPVKVPLVRAYQQCTAPNRVHGPALAHPSCAPPREATSRLTSGTADANGRPTLSEGYVRLRAILGDPGTPADEADVFVRTRITDVLTSPALTDYAGSLRMTVSARITERESASLPATTLTDVPIEADVPCLTTPSEVGGSTCDVMTSMDAVVPGAVVEGRRALWQLGAIRVLDGTDVGAGVLATQGVFIP